MLLCVLQHLSRFSQTSSVRAIMGRCAHHTHVPAREPSCQPVEPASPQHQRTSMSSAGASAGFSVQRTASPRMTQSTTLRDVQPCGTCPSFAAGRKKDSRPAAQVAGSGRHSPAAAAQAPASSAPPRETDILADAFADVTLHTQPNTAAAARCNVSDSKDGLAEQGRTHSNEGKCHPCGQTLRHRYLAAPHHMFIASDKPCCHLAVPPASPTTGVIMEW